MSRKKRTITDATDILRRRAAKDHQLQKMYEEEKWNVQIAMEIRRVRLEAGMTQGALAALVGTTQSAISRLEDADYEGHSLSMLQRIAEALHNQLEVRMRPHAQGF